MRLLGLIELPFWLVAIFLFFFTIIVYTWYKRSFFRRHGIKTKPSTFFLGDLPQISNMGFGYVTPELVKEHGKVFGTFVGNVPSLVISDADMIKEILIKQSHNFIDRMNYAVKIKYLDDVVTFARGHTWEYLRHSLSPSFSARKLKTICPHVDRCLITLHEILEDNVSGSSEDIDLQPIIKNYCVDLMCSTGFGLDTQCQTNSDGEFVKHALEVVKLGFFKNPAVLLNVFFPDLPFLKFLSASLFPEESYNYFKKATIKAFEDRKVGDKPYMDILYTMINAHKEDNMETGTDENANTQSDMSNAKGLSDEEILANSLAFMAAGEGTLGGTLSWLIYDLVLNPTYQDKLIKEVDDTIGKASPTYENVQDLRYMGMSINETLRLHPLNGKTGRVSQEDADVCGVKIPRGTAVAIYPTALHFMEEYWDEPHEYRPERFAPENKARLNEYVYFGWGVGPRICLGKRLAQLEVKMTMASLLQKYRFQRSHRLKVPMDVFKAGVSVPGSPVYVKVIRR